MPRFAIATALFLAAAGLLVSSPVQAKSKKCKPPLVCKPNKAKKPTRVRACPYGKTRSVDTRGKCCWPGQVYSKRKKRCLGTPERCPTPLVAGKNACVNPQPVAPPKPVKSTTKEPQKPVQKPCNFGMSRTADTRGQCCWPGQVSDGERCIGEPTQCPEGFKVGSEECIVQGCAAGQIKPDGVHCCYPGNRWSTSANACVGPSPCPPGTYQREQECLWPESWSSADLRLATDCNRGNGTLNYENGLQCCWPGQLWSSIRKVCVGKAKQCPGDTEDGIYEKRDNTCVFVPPPTEEELAASAVRNLYPTTLSLLAGFPAGVGLRWTQNFGRDWAWVLQTSILDPRFVDVMTGVHWYFVGDTMSFYLLLKAGVFSEGFGADAGIGFEWTMWSHFVMQIELGAHTSRASRFSIFPMGILSLGGRF